MCLIVSEIVFLQAITATGGKSIAPTLEAGVKKDSGPYTFVRNL